MSTKLKNSLADAIRQLNPSKPYDYKKSLSSFNLEEPVRAPKTDAKAKTKKGNTNGKVREKQENLEERGSKIDPVKISPGEPLTRSNSHPVQNSPGQKMTGSNIDPVKENKTKSRKRRSIFKAGTLRAKEDYCSLPNSIIRSPQMLGGVNELCVYLHFFSYSYGFGRNTCSMGVAQLQKFTGLTRNTIRRVLENLVAKKWIKVLSDEEKGRMTRSWRVYSPYEHGEVDQPTFGEVERGSKIDPVKISPGEPLTGRGSNIHPVRGSKFDPYINNSHKQIKNNSSFDVPKEVQSYLDSIRSPRKRAREEQALEDLKTFSKSELRDGFLDLQERGDLNNGDPCHSVLSYFASASDDVLDRARSHREKIRKRRELLEAEQRGFDEAEKSAQEFQAKKIAFFEVFSDPGQRQKIIEELAHGVPFTSEGIRENVAISRWSGSSLQPLKALGEKS